MSTINTHPRNLKDKTKRLYLYYYDHKSKYTKRSPLPYYNTTEGRRLAKKFQQQFDARLKLDQDQALEELIQTAPKLTTVIKEFLAVRVIAPNTAQAYNYYFNLLLNNIGNKRIDKYTEQDGINLIKIMRQKGFSKNTIHSTTHNLDLLFKFCIRNKYCRSNPITVSKRELVQIIIPHPNDLRKLFLYTRIHNKRQYYFIKFAYYTGFRPSTILKLNKNSFDFNSKVIYYENIKGKKKSVFPMHAKLEQLAQNYISYLEKNNIENFWEWHRTDSLYWLRLTARKLNIKINWDMLRSTFATLLANYVNEYAAQVALDHSDSRTTSRYYILPMINKLREDINNKVPLQ